MKDKEARSTRQFLENLQGARMVASGQVAFKISDQINHQGEQQRIKKLQSKTPLKLLQLPGTVGFNVGTESAESSPALTGFGRRLHPRTTKNKELSSNLNLNEPSQDEPVNARNTSYFSPKSSWPEQAHLHQSQRRKGSVAQPFMSKAVQKQFRLSRTRLLSPDCFDQSLTSYPATSDRNRWVSNKKATNSSLNERTSIVQKYYDVKDEPRGFRFADSAAEKYLRNVVDNSEYDTEPTALHNQQIFGRVLREGSRD